MTLEKQIADPVIEQIIKKAASNGYDLQQYRITFLKRRLDARVRKLGLQDYLEYSLLLDKDPLEYIELYKSISINVTEFFRDKEVFFAFGDHIIPKLLSEKDHNETIRIWSAGCATGEEPYGIAILLNEKLKNHTNAFKVYATDINTNALETAKKGKYLSISLKNLSSELVAKYFHVLSDGMYEISQEIKNLVTFSTGDIATFTLNHFDAIFCRNVLIYYEKEKQQPILKKFFNSLKSSGYLVLGMNEGVRGEQSLMFKNIIPRVMIYQKQDKMH